MSLPHQEFSRNNSATTNPASIRKSADFHSLIAEDGTIEPFPDANVEVIAWTGIYAATHKDGAVSWRHTGLPPGFSQDLGIREFLDQPIDKEISILGRHLAERLNRPRFHYDARGNAEGQTQHIGARLLVTKPGGLSDVTAVSWDTAMQAREVVRLASLRHSHNRLNPPYSSWDVSKMKPEEKRAHEEKWHPYHQEMAALQVARDAERAGPEAASQLAGRIATAALIMGLKELVPPASALRPQLVNVLGHLGTSSPGLGKPERDGVFVASYLTSPSTL